MSTKTNFMRVLLKTPVPNRESYIVSVPCKACKAAPGERCKLSMPGSWCGMRKRIGEDMEKHDLAGYPSPHLRTNGQVYTGLNPAYILGWDILRYLGPDVDGLWRYRGVTPMRYPVSWESDEVMNLDND